MFTEATCYKRFRALVVFYFFSLLFICVCVCVVVANFSECSRTTMNAEKGTWGALWMRFLLFGIYSETLVILSGCQSSNQLQPLGT